jgi:hypothetical protein
MAELQAKGGIAETGPEKPKDDPGENEPST